MLTFEDNVIRSAIKVFGEDSQEQMAIEECSELIQAICHKVIPLPPSAIM